MDTAETVVSKEKKHKNPFKNWKKTNWKSVKEQLKKYKWKWLLLRYRTIRTRLLIGFSVLIVLMGTMGVLNYRTIKKNTEAMSDVVQRDLVLYQADNRVSYYMAQRSSALRAYLLTNDLEYYNQFLDYEKQSEQYEETLAKMSNNEELQNLFKQMSDWDRYARNSIVALHRSGQKEKALMNMQEIVDPKGQEIQQSLNELTSSRLNKMDQEVAEALEAAELSSKSTIALSLFSILLSIFLAVLLANSFSRSIRQVMERMKIIAEGKLNLEPMAIEGGGEMAELADATNSMQNQLKSVIFSIKETATTLAQYSEELSQSANEVQSGSEQVALTMQELSIGTENQAHSASDLAANMDAFGLEFTRVTERGQEAADISNGIVELAGKGAELMDTSSHQMNKINAIVFEAVEKMEKLDKETREISKLISLIQSVADQTNLLALNAAIEAARAGEHGRGFAVVADEVRKLSEQVAVNVKEITGFVEKIQEESLQVSDSLQQGYKEVTQGTEQINETSDTFKTIDSSLNSVVQNINEITGNLRTLTDTASEMNVSIGEIASVSEESAAGVEETSAASQQINSTMEEMAANSAQIASEAEVLNTMVGLFQL